MGNDGRTSKPPPFRPRNPPVRDSEPALVAPKLTLGQAAARQAPHDDEPELPVPKAAGAGGIHGLTADTVLPPLEPPPEQTVAASPESTLDLTFDSPTALERLIEDPSQQLLERRAEAMMAELERATSPDEIAMLAYELGELYERWLVDEARAIKSYGRAVAAEARFAPNLWAIRRLFYRRGLWANLHKLIDAELAHAEFIERRAELLLERGIVCERQAKLADAAVAYRACADLAEKPLSALMHLERVALPTMVLEQRVALWTELAQASAVPARRCAYWADIAHAMVSNPEPPDATLPNGGALPAGGTARATAAHGALAYLRAHAPAEDLASDVLTALQVRLAELTCDGDQIAEALHLRAEALHAALERLQHDPPKQESPGEQAALRTQLAAIRRRQAQLASARGDEEGAWESWQQALALAPGETILAEELSACAERTGKYTELADVMASWEAAEADPNKLLALSLRRVDALIRGGKVEQATALLASLDTSAAPATAVLVGLLREREALLGGDDVAAARAQARLAQAFADELADPGAAAFMWTCAAETAERAQSTSDGADALAWLILALDAQPGYMPAILRALEVMMRTSAFAEGAAFCDQMAAQPPGHGSPQERIGYVRFLRERQCEFARLAGQDADALALLGDIARASEPGDPIRWTYEGALALADQQEARLAWVTELANIEPSPARKMEACLTAAHVSERLGLLRPALTWCEQAIGCATSPEAASVFDLTLDLARRHELWQDVYRLQRSRLPALSGQPARAALLECAWLLEFHLADPERSFREYGHILLDNPRDVDAIGGAMRTGLAAIELLSEAECAQLRELARGDAAALVAWANAISKRDPNGARDAFRAAAMLEDAAGDPVAVRFAAQRWWFLAADSGERMAALARLTELAAPGNVAASMAEAQAWLSYARGDHAGRLEGALQGALATAQAPALRMALGTTQAFVAARDEDWDNTAQAWALAANAAAHEMGAWAASTHVRAGLAMLDEHGARAQQHVAEARRAAPHRTDIQVLAADLMGGRASSALPEALSRADEIDILMSRADLLEQRMQLAADPAAQHAWRLDRAEALEAAGRVGDAISEVQAVLRDRRTDIRALEAMRRLGAMAGRGDLQASAAFELATFLRQPVARASLWRQAALLWDVAGADDVMLSKATLAYKRLVIDEPEATEFTRLGELLLEFGEYDELVDVLSQRISHLRHRMHQLQQQGHAAAGREADLMIAPLVDALYDRARYYWHLGDTARALADLRQGLGLAPTHAATRLALEVANAKQAQHVQALARHAAEISGVHDLHAVRQTGAGGQGNPAQSLMDRMDDTRQLLAEHPHRMALYEELLALSRLGGNLLVAGRCESILRSLSGKAVSSPQLPTQLPALAMLVQDVDVPAVASPLTAIWQALAGTLTQNDSHERRERASRATGPEVNLKQLAQGWPVLAAIVAATQRSVRVFITREHPGVCRVVEGEPIQLYISDDVARCSRGADIARAVGALALASVGLGSAANLVPAEVAAWMEAAALSVGVPAAARQTWLDVQGVPSAVDSRVALLAASATEGHNTLMERAFTQLATLPAEEHMLLSQWQGGIAEVALRVALLTTGDLAGVLEGFDITAATLQEDPMARRLLPWFVSEAFAEVWSRRNTEELP